MFLFYWDVLPDIIVASLFNSGRTLKTCTGGQCDYCFIGMAKLIERDKNLLNMLHITDNMNIVAAVICGYPAENPEPKEKKQTAEFFE